MRTFAAPFEKRVLERELIRSLFLRKVSEERGSYLVVMTDRRYETWQRKAQKETSRKFIEKTETVQEASTEKKQFIEKRWFLLEEIISVGIKLEI